MDIPLLNKIIAFANRPKVAEILLLVFVFVYGIIYIDLLSGTWFEDDPLVFFSVQAAQSPFVFFIDNQFFESGAKHQIAPFLYFSLWFDNWLSTEPMKIAYVHNFISLVLTSFLFFKVLDKLFLSRVLSLACVCFWLLLPSTEAVYEFVSARHYLEGFMLSLASIYLLLLSLEDDRKKHKWLLAFGAAILLLCSMFFKEIYAASTLLLFFAICTFKKEFVGSVVSIVFGILYYFYRSFAVGTSVYYGSPLVTGGDFFKYVSHLPYMVSANYGGWIICLATLIGISYLIIKKLAPLKVTTSLIGFIVLGAALTYPVSFALLYYWQAPGTYYRWCFLLNTFILIGLFYLISKSTYIVNSVLLSVLVFSIGLGSFNTQQYFRAEKKLYEIEAEVYLKESNKLFYSEVSAWFFLFGLTKLKELKEMHFVNQANLSPDWLTKEILEEKYSTIWRLKDGKLVSDKPLYDKIVQKYSNRVEKKSKSDGAKVH